MTAACAEAQRKGVTRNPIINASTRPPLMGFGDMSGTPSDRATFLHGKRDANCIGISSIEIFYRSIRKAALIVLKTKANLNCRGIIKERVTRANRCEET